MKTFIQHNFKPIEQINSTTGRSYKTPEGNVYPSVTTVLSNVSKVVIDKWRLKVGKAEADRISKIACLRGQTIHTLCEYYLKDIPFDVNLYDRELFSSLVPFLDRIDNIHALETGMYSDTLKIAGTVDCIAEFDGTLAIIDFKTSKRMKEYKNISSYFMQCAAYSYMFWEQTGILVEDSIVLIGVDDDVPQIFHERVTPWLAEFLKFRKNFTNEVIERKIAN